MANFVCNLGVNYFEIYDIFLVSVMSIIMSCIFSNLRFLKNDSVCALYELIITVRITFF